MKRPVQHVVTDLVVIGGGTAGCMAAIEAKSKDPSLDVLVLEKADIDRSGCLAAGMNAINLYLHPGETPESLARYVRQDAMGLVREDLIVSMAEHVNETVHRVEEWGLPIAKDSKGQYQPRGRWNIKIRGGDLKPLLARKTQESGANILNRTFASGLVVRDNKVLGCVALDKRTGDILAIEAGAVIVTTGGAAGIYRPNNDGDAHHKMWYSPFNTGAGYAMGIRAGAEMTSFEMRFIALRVKDILTPTGTLALGFGAKQVNAAGEAFMEKRFPHMGGNSAPTCLRVYGPTVENMEGRGPCFMDATHLTQEEVRSLKSSYLNMYPDTVLFWAANDIDPATDLIEVCGTEPYLVGGHAQAGYWVSDDRQTSIEGLYAAGDVAGGTPYKFVSGCWAEGVIAASSAAAQLRRKRNRSRTVAATPRPVAGFRELAALEIARLIEPLSRHNSVARECQVTPKEAEARLQKVMDEYAGGLSTYYHYSGAGLDRARQELERLNRQLKSLVADDFHQLMLAHEVIDRIEVSRVLVEHLDYRQETRWPAFQSRSDYPFRDDRHWLKFVNSRRDPDTGDLVMITRPYEQMVPGDRYLP